MRTVICLCALLGCHGRACGDPLAGVVLQEDGQPAAGAHVSAAVIFHSPPWRATSTASDDGTFRIDLPPVGGSERYLIAHPLMPERREGGIWR